MTVLALLPILRILKLAAELVAGYEVLRRMKKILLSKSRDLVIHERVKRKIDGPSQATFSWGRRTSKNERRRGHPNFLRAAVIKHRIFKRGARESVLNKLPRAADTAVFLQLFFFNESFFFMSRTGAWNIFFYKTDIYWASLFFQLKVRRAFVNRYGGERENPTGHYAQT